MVGLTDLGLGLGMLLGDPGRTKAPSFTPAKMVFDFLPGVYPMRVWGAIATVLAILLLISVTGASWSYNVSRISLCAFWAFFAGCFTATLPQPVSFFGPLLTTAWAIRHYRLPPINPWLAR
jgi:hypothetical protein